MPRSHRTLELQSEKALALVRRSSVLLSWVLFLTIHFSVSLANGSETVLQTGGGAALNRVTLPLVIPSNYPSASVQFELSFVTDERLIAGEFLDSFTVSLRNSNRTVVATVLTVDRFGITWAPSSPGALLTRAEDLQFEPDPAPPDASNFLFHTTYTVQANVPAPLLNEPSVIVLNLFDNQNEQHSRAIIKNLRVRLGLGSPINLQSSAIAAGPYALESSPKISRVRQIITAPRAGMDRFFRLRGGTSSRIMEISRPGGDIVLRYDAELGQLNLRLEGSEDPEGPYSAVPNARFDLDARTVSVSLFDAPAFFRIVGSHPVRIIDDEVTGNERVLQFQLAPNPPRVESSAQALGPFAEETVTASAFAQTLTLPRGGAMRFYRLAAEIPLIVRELSLDGEHVVISYEEPVQ